MVVAWTYAVAVNFSPSYRVTVDKIGESTIGLQNGESSGVVHKDVEAAEVEKEMETKESVDPHMSHVEQR
jgi:FHS family L-fucose permease-like MFS transporter